MMITYISITNVLTLLAIFNSCKINIILTLHKYQGLWTRGSTITRSINRKSLPVITYYSQPVFIMTVCYIFVDLGLGPISLVIYIFR